LQSEWVETGSMIQIEQALLPPAFSFTGEVKRTEWYSTVTPGFVERALISQDIGGGMVQKGQRRRWYAALPLRFGDDVATMPDADAGMAEAVQVPEAVTSSSVQYVRRPSQLLAARQLRASPSNKLVLSTAVELTALVERDGGVVAKSEGRPLVVQYSRDVKYGFNERRQLAMSVWLSVPDALREEYVAVVVEKAPP